MNIKRDLFRIFLVVLGAVLMALNINSFVYTAELLPGGFTGVAILIQEVFDKILGIKIPFSPFYWTLNMIPAAFCFKYVGKKFTIYSLVFVLLSGLFADIFPNFTITGDILLCAVFGGLFSSFAITCALFADATSGGTDFISIIVSEKTGKSSWNYIFIGNCCVLVLAGILFGWDKALYSIIYQYTSTQVLNLLYKRYQKTTLLVITEKTNEIVKLISDTTHHDATLFKGNGCYQGAERKMLYTVVSSEEAEKLCLLIKQIDPGAFINLLQTKSLHGKFFMRKKD